VPLDSMRFFGRRRVLDVGIWTVSEAAIAQRLSVGGRRTLSVCVAAMAAVAIEAIPIGSM